MIRNILAVIAGFVAGSLVNGLLVTVGPSLIPVPAGVDMTTMEGMKAGIPLLQAQHFIFPFLAHALGTLVGTLVAAVISVGHKLKVALVLGVIFLIGGITASFMIPAPVWFIAVDLIFAYIPMGWIAAKLAGADKPNQSMA